MKYDCVIIGAGMSGLAAAIRLAHYEKKVCICESHFQIGGLNSYYSRNGIELECGLHAMTNFASSNAKTLPLLKLLRQLRIPYDSIAPREQHHSVIKFPGAELKFSNNFLELSESIATSFPLQIDNFTALDNKIMDWNEVNLDNPFISAREIVGQYITDPLLRDMLFCPLMYYGSAQENDMDFSQFAIMYKSIFKEGFFRPGHGIRGLLNILIERLRETGAELRLNCSIDKIIIKNNRAVGVVTHFGEFIEAANFLSSAGAPETAKLCDSPEMTSFAPTPGKLAFMETIVLPSANTDIPDSAIIFFNSADTFAFRNPKEDISIDSGVICFPSNFKMRSGDAIPPRLMRTTVLANNQLWFDYNKMQYSAHKQQAFENIITKSLQLAGMPADTIVRPIDAFTPKTITRYTARINGAIYGSPIKYKTGITPINNVYLCGTDQGFLGITGALLSGISMANMHLLK
jgi:phytoene dehydrogenase-like protein